MTRTIVLAIQLQSDVPEPGNPEDAIMRVGKMIIDALVAKLEEAGIEPSRKPYMFTADLEPSTVFGLVEDHQIRAQLMPPKKG